MRRAGSMSSASTLTSPPRSGDSLKSNGSYSRRLQRQKRRASSSSSSNIGVLIRILIAIALLIAAFDLFLFIRKQRIHSASMQDAIEQHHHYQQKPPVPVRGDGDDAVPHEGDTAKDVDEDKAPVYEILRQAGINPDTLDNDTKRQLPTWSTVQRLYGTAPRIYGLDTCARFREITDPSQTFLAIAGTFNSGTNLLSQLMIQNCQIDERMAAYGEKQKGMRWQVKWGKHTPPRYREQHVTTTDGDVPLEYTLPLITIRDPYSWMQSMCRHAYAARWPHNAKNCPHVYNEHNQRTSKVTVAYAEATLAHESLPGMWNDWYNEYMNVDFPRVMVRMEDLIFYGKNVTETLCQCGGGSPRRKQFRHVSESAKLGTAAHGNHKTSLLQAIIHYGTDKGRLHQMTDKDLQVTKEILDPHLMELFNYQNP